VVVPIAANSSNAQLTVAVTVTRSCAIDAGVAADGSPTLNVECAAHGEAAFRTAPAQRITGPTIGGWHVVTVNF